MSKADLIRDALRLKLRIGEEVVGMLPDGIQAHVAEKRREILQVIQEVCTEFLAENPETTKGNSDLKSVSID